MPRVFPPIEGKSSTTLIQHIPPSVVEVVAGFTAGVVSTLVVHPFDVVKTRLQVDQSARAQVGNSLRIASSIARNEGFWQGFYRGLAPNLIGNSVSWGLYFMWYGNIKDLIRASRGGADTQLGSADYFLASALSGILTAVFTNPIWVIKTRMLSTSRNTPGAYTSVAQGTRQLYRTEGIKGFYRGLVPSLFGVSHGAVQFMAYEQLKLWRRSVLSSNQDVLSSSIQATVELTNWDYLVLSATSKIFAGSITYPYQVIRTRLQTYDSTSKYTSIRELVRQVWTTEGALGFYKGLGPNIIRVLPSTCVTFLVYENTKFYLPRFFNDDSASSSTATSA